MNTAIALNKVNLPDFGLPTVEPVLPPDTYRNRVDAALARTRADGIDVLLVYADREHNANLLYLTGFDPRFEEALLVLPQAGEPSILVGNECWGHADISPLPLRKILFQDFSLLGQPRDTSAPLEEILRAAGITAATRVGIAGWKYFTDAQHRKLADRIEVPAYLADTLRSMARSVVNATDLFMDAENGLRVVNEVDQLAVFEYAGTIASEAVKRVLFGIRPGMTEHEAVELMRLNGMPWSCHLMLSTGAKARFGMSSPSSKRVAHGDAFTCAYGLWGSLTSRAGFLVESAAELPAPIRDYAEKLAQPYFRAVTDWYAEIGIGVAGGTLYETVHRTIGSPFFNVTLNPGHQIGTDEWLNSPIFKGSGIALRSGMALQADVIPATGTPYFMSNIEDGLALADAPLRAAYARKYPESWQRIQARRSFMHDTLGIRLKPEVLPFSNIPAYLPPFVLNPRRVLTRR